MLVVLLMLTVPGLAQEPGAPAEAAPVQAPAAPADAVPAQPDAAPGNPPAGAAPSSAGPAPQDGPEAPAVPSSTPDAPAETAPAAGAGDAPVAGTDRADEAVPVEGSAAPVVADEPAPSLLEDPAGALSDMLAPAGRDPTLPHDLSPWGMFLAADWVVKAVMIGLAFASLVTWTVWLAKSVEIACAKARAGRALKVIASAATLEEASRSLAGRGGPGAFMVRAAEDELKKSEAVLDHAGTAGVKERVAARLARIEAQAGRRLSRGTGVLATIGSTAPFVGLFGTVWGIMNSFIGISEAQTTNLAVVAPGIAEALLATAIGLVAAIPAVVVYNVFARSITGYRQLLADAASGVEQVLGRDLDHRMVPKSERLAPVQAAE